MWQCTALFFSNAWKWKRADNQGKVFRALSIDLPKTFDCLPQQLIIGKIYAYEFNLAALKLMNDWLSKRR